MPGIYLKGLMISISVKYLRFFLVVTKVSCKFAARSVS